jgi:predicted nucleotidyltransferase
MVRRIVAKFRPEQVILFGSYARDSAGPNSDADLLVVMHIEGRKRPTIVEMYRELSGVGLAKDIVLATPQEVERRRHEPGSLIHNALQEGRVLYDHARLGV